VIENRPQVDLLLLSRPHTAVSREVIASLHGQLGVDVTLHHGIGWPERNDANRWFTIARARNELRLLGKNPWVMFVDDDVVLDPHAVRTLVAELEVSKSLGAIAADYDSQQKAADWDGHVTLGACLFRREVLADTVFRATNDQCECACLCHDLRQRGIGITYSRNARAIHLKPSKYASADKPIVMAAFDRRDLKRFEESFLATFRRWGNQERVVAVVYGAYPSEISRIERLENVQVIARPFNGQMVPVRRLDDFADVCSSLAPNTPVAYWDVADVIFQTSLQRLWEQVRTWPNRLIAVSEPNGYPGNEVIPFWSLSIRDAECSQKAYRLLQTNPFLNSGFAAGTANAMHAYFREASQYLVGPELYGSTDWGDQMCLNLYCHTHPHAWREPDQGWNFCVHDRQPGEVCVTPDGYIVDQHGNLIPIVHRNARSLRQFSLIGSH
jgi:hypothetical protein